MKTLLLFLPAYILVQIDSTLSVIPDGEIFGVSWKWILGTLGSLEVILRLLPINKKWSIINLISIAIKLIPAILDKAHEKIPNNVPVKMIAFLFASSVMLSACQAVKVGGNITSFATTDSSTVIGAHFRGEGSLQPKLDSLAQGYPIMFGAQQFQATYGLNYFDINALFNFKK